MFDEFEYNAFLSHSAKDKDIVRDIANRLKSDGVRVWFDEWEIKPGDSIPAKIEEGLEHGEHRTPNAQQFSASMFDVGRSTFKALEIHTFRFKDPLNHNRRFIPLRLDNAPTKGSLAQFSFIDGRRGERKNEYPKLLEACRSQLQQRDAVAEVASELSSEKVFQLNRKGEISSDVFSADGSYALTNDRNFNIEEWDLIENTCVTV